MKKNNYDLVVSLLNLLKQCFLVYSRKGDKLTFNQMGFSSFLKFYKDNIFSLKNEGREHELEETDVLIIFITLTGFYNYYSSDKLKTMFNNNSGYVTPFGELYNNKTFIDKSKILQGNKENIALKVDFNLFIKSFEFSARRMYPNLNNEEAFKTFLEKDLQKVRKNEGVFMQEKKDVLERLESVKEEELTVFAIDLERVLDSYYCMYANNKKKIGFDQFFEFCKDFNLFPEVVNLVQLKNIFFTMLDVETENYKSAPEEVNLSNATKINSDTKMNMRTFITCLMIIATSIYVNATFSLTDKVLYLVERMNSSEGVKKANITAGKT